MCCGARYLQKRPIKGSPRALVGQVVRRLMQTGPVGVLALMFQLLLELSLLLGRLPGVFGRRRWVDVDLLIHARSPPNFDDCF
jgi:hypothetical protein